MGRDFKPTGSGQCICTVAFIDVCFELVLRWTIAAFIDCSYRATVFSALTSISRVFTGRA